MPHFDDNQPVRKTIPLVILLTLVWGTNWPLFPLAVREVSVWTFRSVCLLGGGVALLTMVRLRGGSISIAREHWRHVAFSSLTYLTIWNIASTYAAILIPSGQAAILGFTMPLWTALISWAVLGQRPSPRILLALAIGCAGVLLLIANGLTAYAKAPLGFGLGLFAGIGWAVGTLMLKRWPIPGSPFVITGWQLLVAAVPITIVALILGGGHWFVPSTGSVVLIAYIMLVPIALGNAMWFSIVGRLPANVAGLSSVMVPVVAMIGGAILNHEPLGLVQWISMLCCTAGVGLALQRRS